MDHFMRLKIWQFNNRYCKCNLLFMWADDGTVMGYVAKVDQWYLIFGLLLKNFGTYLVASSRYCRCDVLWFTIVTISRMPGVINLMVARTIVTIDARYVDPWSAARRQKFQSRGLLMVCFAWYWLWFDGSWTSSKSFCGQKIFMIQGKCIDASLHTSQYS